jgi:hypothetical protein
VNETSESKSPVIIDGTSGELIPTPSRIDLSSINDVRLEMAKVYRDMKSGKIETADGTKLTYVLAQIGKLIETHEIERRIEALESVLTQRKKVK